jgi:hypothetical protein
MNRTSRKLIAGSLTGLLAAAAATTALAKPHHPAVKPVNVTVFSPGSQDRSGTGGVGFIVDLSLDATNRKANALLSPAAGYKPAFNDPAAPTSHPGPDPGSPGLVVMLSSTPNKPDTPFQGPRTNVAGLFQINGIAKVRGLAETWNTWQPGKPLFGLNKHVRLTVYVVRGTAPGLVPTHGLNVISNTVHGPVHDRRLKRTRPGYTLGLHNEQRAAPAPRAPHAPLPSPPFRVRQPSTAEPEP